MYKERRKAPYRDCDFSEAIHSAMYRLFCLNGKRKEVEINGSKNLHGPSKRNA